MNHATVAVTGRAVGKKMTLADLRAFVAACDAHGVPEDTIVEARTAGLSPVGIRSLTAAPPALFGEL